MIKFISQSFIKDFGAYIDGDECGIVIREKYVNDRLLDDPDAEPGARELGSYFEFMAFGTLPKSKIVPKPKMLADGKTMAAEYRLATINAKKVKKIITEDYGLEILKPGWTVTKGRFRGTIDLLVKATKDMTFENGISWKAGDVFVIDLKYSGLIGETTPAWNKHGWKWSPVQKAYHGIQATQYHFLTDVPFYYFVCQSNNKEGTPSDMRFFHVPITPMMLWDHIQKGNTLFDRFQVLVAMDDLKPRPSLRRCSKCPLAKECTVKHTFPHPEVIDLNAA